MSTSTTRWLSTTTHAALAAASGYLGKIWKSSGRRQTGSHKDRTWCLLTPSPTLQRPTTLRLGTPRASSYGCSARALLSPSYLHLPWARHIHTHTHTHTQPTQTHACIQMHAPHGGTNTNREHRLLKHLCFLFGFVSPC